MTKAHNITKTKTGG